MKTSATNRRIRVLLTAITNGTLVPKPEFQRRLVWNNKHKSSFIRTVLQGYPFPEIYIAAGEVDQDTGEGTELLVDGQQRISTLYQYFKGSDELKLDKDITPYADLTKDDKMEFLEYEVVARDLGKMSIEQIKEIFQRINSTSYSLNAMEIHNARYDGEFKKYGEALAEHDFYQKHKTFTTRDTRRMHDIRFCLTLVVTMMSTYFNRDDEIESYLEKYNEEFDVKDDLNKDINSVFNFIDSCDFSNDSRVWKKVDLFSLMIECYKILIKEHNKLSPTTCKLLLDEFYSKIDNDELRDTIDAKEYYQASIQATNDRSSRIKRGRAIRKHLINCLVP